MAPTETSQPPKESPSSEGGSTAAAKPPSDDPFMAFEQSSTPQKVHMHALVCIYMHTACACTLCVCNMLPGTCMHVLIRACVFAKLIDN